MQDLNDKIEVSEDEIQDQITDESISHIKSWGADLTFRELITMWDESELQKPEIQRKYVWDKMEASRFIESILLGLPIPSVFLAKTTEHNSLIVDGFQRIMTVYDYVKGVYQTDGTVFRLSNSKAIVEKWRNKAFVELSTTDQKKIRSKPIHAIIFDSSHPEKHDSSLYQIFERINTSGRTLMTQEIRNCIYQGWVNTLLIELNKLPKWRNLFGDVSEDTRMRDIELILRYFALKNVNWNSKELTTTISLKRFLNDYMEDMTKSSESSNKSDLKRDFSELIDFVYAKFGVNAFRTVTETGLASNKIHPTVMDSIMIASRIAIDKGVSEPIAERSILFNNASYKESISSRTTNTENIQKRIAIVCKLLYGIEYDK
jgi:uncharacterized protein with ParB-like and HNH nuclease domain